MVRWLLIRTARLAAPIMKIAIPLLNERVAPDFSTATGLLVVVSQEGNISCRWRMEVSELSPLEKARKLVSLGIDRLVCGGIEISTRAWLERRGVQVVTDVVGEAEKVLSDLAASAAEDPEPDGAFQGNEGRPDGADRKGETGGEDGHGPQDQGGDRGGRGQEGREGHGRGGAWL
jgi:predicted Fe-Mo cluster-binding NifX family protein